MSITPFDVGAHGDGVRDDAPFLQKAYNLARENGWQLLLPSATYSICQELDFSGAVTVRGANWRTTILRANAAVRSVLKIGSSSVLQDLKIDGNKIAQSCLRVLPGNRCHVQRIRTENTVSGIGLYVDGEMNNSLFCDVMSQGNHINFLIRQGLNLTFFNCNGNLDNGTRGTARCILFRESRNCRFIGGIFERGNMSDYQIEVPAGNRSIIFRDLEANAAKKAAIGVTGGEVMVRDVHFTLSATCKSIELLSGSCEVRGWTASGKEGRDRSQLFDASVSFV